MPSDASWLEDMPALYDRALGPTFFAPFATSVAERVAALAPERVLELAAGTGVLTAALVAALPQAAITASDLNPGMVAYGTARVAGARWEQADAQALAHPDSSFDVVTSQFGVMFFPDKPKAFAETARVLTGAGRTVFAVWDAENTSGFGVALRDSLMALFPDDPPDFVSRIPHGYFDEQRIRADLEAGGLQMLNVERVVLPTLAPDARTLALGYSQGTPLRFALEARRPIAEVTQQLGVEMENRLSTGPLASDAAALIVTARRA